jgi:ribosomal protein L18
MIITQGASEPDAGRVSGLVGSEVSRLVNHGIFAENSANRAVLRALKEHVEICGDMPVVGVRKYRRDWVVQKKAGFEIKAKGAKRGEITAFSAESRYRLLHLAKNCNADFKSMITLTYPALFPGDGHSVKRHLKNFKDWLSRECEDVKALWFLEFQKRGAPHFHMLVDIDLSYQGVLALKKRTGVRRGEKSNCYETCQICEDRASEAWYRIVGSTDEKHLRAGVCWERLEDEDAALKYAAKHAAKCKQKLVPEKFLNVGRFWGKLGDIKLIGGELEHVTVDEILGRFGGSAISRHGRVKKYLWDAWLTG